MYTTLDVLVSHHMEVEDTGSFLYRYIYGALLWHSDATLHAFSIQRYLNYLCIILYTQYYQDKNRLKLSMNQHSCRSINLRIRLF